MNATPGDLARQRGMVLIEQGRFPEARSYLRDALAADPDDPWLHYFLSVSQLNSEEGTEALESVKRGIALLPQESRFHALKAHILGSLERPEEARKAANEALRLDPDSEAAHTALSSSWAQENNWKNSEAEARKALELDPENESAAYLLAQALRMQNRLEESSEQAHYMLGRNPDNAVNHISAGWLALQRGSVKQSEEHFLEALRLDSSNEAARDGLKQAFRARSPFYRAYLNYCFFIGRFTQGKQWLLIIGFLILARIAAAIPGPAGTILPLLYLLFILWLHVAESVGNLGLLFDRFARHALTTLEKIDSVVTGGAVLCGLGLLAAGYFTGMDALLFAGFVLVAASFPIANTIRNRSTAGRIVFGGLAAAIFVVQGLLIGALLVGREPGSSLVSLGFLVPLLAMIATTWLVNIRALRQ